MFSEALTDMGERMYQNIFPTQPLLDYDAAKLHKRGRYMGSAHFMRTPSRASSYEESKQSSRHLLDELTKEVNEINPALVQELDRIAKGKTDLSIISMPKKRSDTSNEQDYDTDLDIDDIEENGNYKTDDRYDASGTVQYLECCEQLKVVPVKFFMRNYKEREFTMRYHGLGPAGALALCVPLERNTHIHTLNLEGNDIASNGVASLCQMLKENLYISELNLAENSISSPGAAVLCDLLSSSNRLVSVDLSGNLLSDQDAPLFSEMLQRNTTLRQFFLSHNRFGDRSGPAFKEAISNNDTLHVLDLSWNMFRKSAIILIAEGIKENVGLKRLNLRMNGSGCDGAVAMGQALVHNRSLTDLDLSSNRIPLQGAIVIAKGINSNDILTTIKMGNNPLTPAGAFCLLTALQGNENSQVTLVDLSHVYVNPDFIQLKNKLESDRKKLKIIHGSSDADDFKKVKREDQRKLARKSQLKAILMNNPLAKLKEYMARNGLRLLDFFKQLDRDQSNTVTYDELRKGCETYKINLKEEEIKMVVKLLDSDGSGDIDFQELVAADKEYKFLRRALLKEIAILEEEERQRRQKVANMAENVENVDLQKMSREEAWEVVEEVMKSFYDESSADTMPNSF